MSDEQFMGEQRSGRIIRGLLGACVGAGIGFAMSPVGQTIWSWSADQHKSAVLVLLGAAVALIYHRWQTVGRISAA